MARMRLQLFAVIVATMLAIAPTTVRAQELPEPDVDLYYAGAVTAGIVIGSAVAFIVTDGLIVPVLSTATGGVIAGLEPTLTGAAGLFGAVVGAMYASDWYERETSWINVSW